MTMVLEASVKENATWIIVACVAMAVVVLMFACAWLWMRRWLKAESTSDDNREPWTLADLRQLRERGEVTEEEYQAMRAAMIASYRGKDSTPGTETGVTDNSGAGDKGPFR